MLGDEALAGSSALLESNQALVCQKIVCSQSAKQRISFKEGQKYRAHLQPAKAYSAELIHRESRRVDEYEMESVSNGVDEQEKKRMRNKKRLRTEKLKNVQM